MTLAARRHFGWILFAVAASSAWLLDYAMRVHLRRPELFTGLALFAVVVLLTLFNARKKLPFLPLLRASTWMQVHIYVGLLSCVLFVLHAEGEFRRANLKPSLPSCFILSPSAASSALPFHAGCPATLPSSEKT